MGCFGYLCSVCNEQIVGDCFNGGEHCVLIHKRHGQEVGRTTGHYNEYGTVVEEKKERSVDGVFFRSYEGTHINSHNEICDSEMSLPDSKSFGGRKWVNEKSVAVSDLRRLYISKVEAKQREKLYKSYFAWKNEDESTRSKEAPSIDITEVLDRWEEDNHEEKYEFYLDLLEDVETLSGIVACHKVCYDKLSDEEQKTVKFSDSDPNQSWGEIKREFA